LVDRAGRFRLRLVENIVNNCLQVLEYPREHGDLGPCLLDEQKKKYK
jgi:hypothetical protein